MATTNKEIIATYCMLNNIDMRAGFHTFKRWQELGYSVKKGAKCNHKLTIWNCSTKKIVNENTGDEVESRKMYTKTAYFFTRDQVEEMKK